MPKLVAVQLETCHANSDGTAWYGYFTGPVEFEEEDTLPADESVIEEVEAAVEKSSDPLSIEVEDWEEVPNALSRHTGLRRYYVGAAV